MKHMLVKLLLAAALCLMALSACSGTIDAKTVTAKAMFTNEELTLPLPAIQLEREACGAPGHYGYVTFSTCFWPRQLPEKLYAADPSVTISGDNDLLLTRENAHGSRDYFRLLLLRGQSYRFSGMRAGLVTKASSDGGKQVRAILLPYHLLTDNRLNEPFVELYLNAEYETEAGLKEFFAFYRDSGWYEVEQKDGCVLINGYKNPDAVVDNPDDADKYGTLLFDAPLKIRFRDFGDKRYFSFTEPEQYS